MQSVGNSLLAVFESPERDLLDVFEFYSPAVTNLIPANASKLFSASAVIWDGNTYEQQLISRGDVTRYFGEKFNSCSITLSNIDRSVGEWVSGTSLEGYRVIVRCISRQVDNDSLVLFVGRCDKAYEVDNETVQISAKQDLGSIENDLPWNTFSEKCPLDFQGAECLAGESLGSKSGAYQAANSCNKSWAQCVGYSNQEAFQGFRGNAMKGNFKLRQQRGGSGGAFLSLLGLGKKAVTKQWTAQNDSPYGKAVPLGFGRTQIELTPVNHADTGQFIAGESIVGEGELTKLVDVRNVTSGFATTFQNLDVHLGAYGPDSEQDPVGFFDTLDARYSHRAYVEFVIKGENPDTGEPSPTLVALVLWTKIPTWDGSDWTTIAWTDNPVEILRYILTEPRSLNYNPLWIDDAVAGASAEYCREPLTDSSGGEDFYVSTSAGTAGTDFKRYRSTGLIDVQYWRHYLGLTSTYSAERETTYNTFAPTSAPSNPTPSTVFRKRWTANFHLKEKVKAADFIFKKLLPSFKGYLVTGADGKLQIRCEKPAVGGFLRSGIFAPTVTIPIEDALTWKAAQAQVPTLYAIIGDGLPTSECHVVDDVLFSTAGNSVAIAKTVTGGGVTVTLSGATLSGGSTTVQASATITVGGTPAAGNTIEIDIDGVDALYTVKTGDTTATVAAMIATAINANATHKRYLVAEWNGSTVVTVKSKLGNLILADPVAVNHNQLEEVTHVHGFFGDVAFQPLTRGNILRGSFKWSLGSRQSSYNQFVITYTDALADFQETELRENDYSHQNTVNKVNKLEIDGDCVDSYHQADRLVQSLRYKFREGDFFCALSSAGVALLHEEGDLIAVNHSAMPNRLNTVLRAEEVRIAADWKVAITGRLYSKNQYPETATGKTIVLTTGIGWPSATPGAPASLALTEPVAGTVRGTFTFPDSPGAQTARIEVKKAGAGSFIDTGQRITPDTNNDGAFEVSGLPSGSTEFRVTVISANNVEGTPDTETIAVTGVALISTYTTAIVGALNSPFTVGFFTPAKDITVNRVIISCRVGPTGCGTNAVIRVAATAGNVDTTLTTATADSGAVSLAVPAGDTVYVTVQTGASGCTITPSDATITVQYEQALN
jgi:hypothetical protein